LVDENSHTASQWQDMIGPICVFCPDNFEIKSINVSVGVERVSVWASGSSWSPSFYSWMSCSTLPSCLIFPVNILDNYILIAWVYKLLCYKDIVYSPRQFIHRKKIIFIDFFYCLVGSSFYFSTIFVANFNILCLNLDNIRIYRLYNHIN